jgi:hypothetical protein
MPPYGKNRVPERQDTAIIVLTNREHQGTIQSVSKAASFQNATPEVP